MPRPDDVELILQSLPAVEARSRPALVALVGLPGTGKSVFARALAERTGASILESDAIRRLLFHHPSYSPAESGRLFLSIHAAIDRLLAAGAAVILDATNLTKSERRPLVALAKKHDAALVFVLLTAPREAVHQRLAGRQTGEGVQSEAGIEVYERMRPRLEGISQPHHVVDSTRPIDLALDAVAAELGESTR